MANLSRHIEGFEILRAEADGSVIVKLSPAAIEKLEEIAAAAAPTIKAKLYQNELKRGEAARERLDRDMGAVKANLMRDLFDPDLTRLGLIKRGPLNWQ